MEVSRHILLVALHIDKDWGHCCYAAGCCYFHWLTMRQLGIGIQVALYSIQVHLMVLYPKPNWLSPKLDCCGDKRRRPKSRWNNAHVVAAAAVVAGDNGMAILDLMVVKTGVDYYSVDFHNCLDCCPFDPTKMGVRVSLDISSWLKAIQKAPYSWEPILKF